MLIFALCFYLISNAPRVHKKNKMPFDFQLDLSKYQQQNNKILTSLRKLKKI